MQAQSSPYSDNPHATRWRSLERHRRAFSKTRKLSSSSGDIWFHDVKHINHRRVCSEPHVRTTLGVFARNRYSCQPLRMQCQNSILSRCEARVLLEVCRCFLALVFPILAAIAQPSMSGCLRKARRDQLQTPFQISPTLCLEHACFLPRAPRRTLVARCTCGVVAISVAKPPYGKTVP